MKYKYELPPLPYPYDALEPYIDARTMEIHHDKHHGTYVAKLNEALEQWPAGQEKTLEELLSNLEMAPEAVRQAVRNHGGGHFNHSIFWPLMKKGGGGEPTGELAEALRRDFGDFAKFKAEFTKTCLGVFGSGWAWLAIQNPKPKIQNSKLLIVTTPNQDTPLAAGLKPILGLDVWEHAYYLKYQNRRPEYVEAWWHVVNWEQVAENLQNALKFK